MDYLRFHFIEVLFGVVLTVGGFYKIATYAPFPNNVPFTTLVPNLAVFWFTVVCGVLTLVWPVVMWNKHRVL